VSAGVLAATAGFALLIAAGVTSYRLARRRLAYETWWSRERVRLDAARLEALAPGLAGRDVYVRGPDGFAAAVTAAVREAGVPADRIHHESFAL
jgi:ferredoxin-NADP reductase